LVFSALVFTVSPKETSPYRHKKQENMQHLTYSKSRVPHVYSVGAIGRNPNRPPHDFSRKT
jgi:hypothetical protein